MRHWLFLLRRVQQPTIVAIIVVAAIVFLVQETFDLRLAIHFGAVPARITQAWEQILGGGVTGQSIGALATLVTAIFLHGSPDHIVFNMVFLWTFGSLTARHLGKWWVLGLFFVCGACGNVMQVCLNPDSPIPIVGASGAITGFEGIYLGLALRWRLPNPDVWPLARPIPPMQLALFAIIGVAFDFYALMNHRQCVAYGAHVGGFLSGLLIAMIVTQAYRSEEAFRGVK